MKKNHRTTFEFIAISDSRKIENAYWWCRNNLPLTDGVGIRYEGNELFIITSSQKIIDKINKHFGSKFCFRDADNWGTTAWYI